MTKKSFNIPSHWTPEQADAVFEMVCELETAIFAAYEEPLVRLAIREATSPPPPDFETQFDLDNDDIPW